MTKSYVKCVHYQAKVITLSDKRGSLHYHANIIALSGSKFITLSVDVITLSGIYYIIRRLLHYQAVITVTRDYYNIGCNNCHKTIYYTFY